MESKGVRAAKLIQIEGGSLIELVLRDKVWVFVFQNNFTVECYGGWRILIHDFGGKTLLGCRDLSGADEPYKDIMNYLEGFELTAVNYNELADTVQLQLMGENDRITLDLFASSAKEANWKFIGEDFEDTDKDDLLKIL